MKFTKNDESLPELPQIKGELDERRISYAVRKAAREAYDAWESKMGVRLLVANQSTRDKQRADNQR